MPPLLAASSNEGLQETDFHSQVANDEALVICSWFVLKGKTGQTKDTLRCRMTNTFEQKTIRDPLLGMVVDHLSKGQIQCGLTHQVGCELVALLAAYREEDRRLFPQVYLLGPSKINLLQVIAPGEMVLKIGEAEDGLSTPRLVASTALKTCASLAIDGWCVFIRRLNLEQKFDFGLFRTTTEAYSDGPESHLKTLQLPTAIFRQCAENTVEIVNGVGGNLEISLTTATPSNQAASKQVLDFSRAACADVVESSKNQASDYLGRILTEFLRESHGALLAVASCKKPLDPEVFSDGVILQEPVLLIETMLKAMRAKTAAGVLALRSQESLLHGMINSDGVTILGTDGSIRAFRVFVHRPRGLSEAQRKMAPDGARSRAFEVLRSLVGETLQAALFRSQDGRTEVMVNL